MAAWSIQRNEAAVDSIITFLLSFINQHYLDHFDYPLPFISFLFFLFSKPQFFRNKHLYTFIHSMTFMCQYETPGLSCPVLSSGK